MELFSRVKMAPVLVKDVYRLTFCDLTYKYTRACLYMLSCCSADGVVFFSNL